MTTNLKVTTDQELPKEAKELINLKDQSLVLDERDVAVGDLLKSKSNDDLYTVLGFNETEKYGTYIVHDNYRHNDSGIGEMSMSDFRQYYVVIKGYSYDEISDIADSILAGTFDENELKHEEVKEEGLMVVNADLYKTALADSERMKDKVSLIQNLVKQKSEAIRNRMRRILDKHYTMISRLNSIVFTLELYAGIKESVKQIQEGKLASEDEPIYLNQLMRFMDEEVGDPDNGGISFDTLEDFDNWLLGYSKHQKCFHYEFLMPQKKSIRIMRVRRRASERYTSDAYNNRWEINQELRTYVIIRNGENIYTIDSEMEFGDRLFPDQEELGKIVNMKDADSQFTALEKYKNGMVLMQGLLDRTTIFGNLMGKVSFLNLKSQERGEIVFQYEIPDTRLVTDGSKTFLDFLNTSEIKLGDRILLYSAYSSSDWRNSRWLVYYNEYNTPDAPEDGIYKIDSNKSDTKSNLIIKYMPNSDTAYGWGKGGEARKNKVSWIIKPEDSNIVNIDMVSHRNIKWINDMQYDRRDRIHYLRSAGLLRTVQKFKNEELEKERPFAQMLIGELNLSELKVLDAIHWWKTKNKHKRPISLDDKKAYRMIKKHLLK